MCVWGGGVESCISLVSTRDPPSSETVTPAGSETVTPAVRSVGWLICLLLSLADISHGRGHFEGLGVAGAMGGWDSTFLRTQQPIIVFFNVVFYYIITLLENLSDDAIA